MGISVGLRLSAGLAFGGGLSVLMGDGSRAVAVALVASSLLVGAITALLDLAFLSYDKAPPRRSAAYALMPWADPRGQAGLQLLVAM